MVVSLFEGSRVELGQEHRISVWLGSGHDMMGWYGRFVYFQSAFREYPAIG